MNLKEKIAITFCGGAGSVTGANFLLEAKGKKILVDCGLVQSASFADEENRKDFSYNPSEIDYLFVTHAHIDHIGRIPKLVASGFKGKILSTRETRLLSELMLEDAFKLIQEECKVSGKEPLYEQGDVARALTLWGDIPYHENFPLFEGVSVFSKDAGHILGSAMYTFEITQSADRRGLDADQPPFTTSERGYGGARRGKEEMKKLRIVFTGDLGNSPTPILRDTETISNADYLVMESVYGDRNHEDKKSRRARLKNVIIDAVKRKGALIVPIFSLEKTQVLLYELRELEQNHEIPIVPVFLDSPLAIAVTKIYQEMRGNFNDKALAEEAKEGDIFKFPRLKYTAHSEESKAIFHVASPKIILAGSGMSNGGRILHHEINYLPGENNTILFVGYQAAGTLGRQIQDGAKEVIINEQKVTVRAKVETISGYSSHKDSEHLVEFVSHSAETLKKVFVVTGEPKASFFLAQRLRDYIDVPAVVPESGQTVKLE